MVALKDINSAIRFGNLTNEELNTIVDIELKAYSSR